MSDESTSVKGIAAVIQGRTSASSRVLHLTLFETVPRPGLSAEFFLQPYKDEQRYKPTSCRMLPPHVALKENLHRVQLLVCPPPAVHEPNLLSAVGIAKVPWQFLIQQDYTNISERIRDQMELPRSSSSSHSDTSCCVPMSLPCPTLNPLPWISD